MIKDTEFENILKQPESSTLDFKRINYALTHDIEQIGTSKFVKDIISFANTIRTDSAYIIIGIDSKPDNSKELIGIEENIDEAILQDKIKDKVYPRPVFKFHYYKYNDLNFGIIEIPIQKYSIPISPIVKLKGLEVGKIYFRRGSSNTEALGVEIININDWLRSLPEINEIISIHDEVTNFIKRLTIREEKLSVIITDILLFAKKNKLIELIDFCSNELVGIDTKVSDLNPKEFEYRILTTKMSLNKIEINHFSFVKATENMLRDDIEKSEDYFDLSMLFSKPITEIEEYINRIKDDTLCSIMETSSNKLFPDKNGTDYPVYIYIFKDGFMNLYRNIRQKTIDKLMKI